MATLPKLTSSELKISLYLQEPYFREALDDAMNTLVDEKRLHSLAVVMFLPDAVVAHKINLGLQLLRGHGFVPLLWRRCALDRFSTRELWRYQLNVATLDHLALMDLLNTSCDSLWIVLRDISPVEHIPASVRLALLKGSARPDERHPGNLRSALGSPNRILAVLHAPDEPADVIRETGILFEGAERRRIFSEAAECFDHDATSELGRVISELSEGQGEANFDAARALRRIEDRIETASTREGWTSALTELRHYVRDARNGVPVAWRSFMRAVSTARLNIDRWDLIVFGSQFVLNLDDPTRLRMIDGGTCIQGWLRPAVGTVESDQRLPTGTALPNRA